MSSNRIYVGGLDANTKKEDLDDAFQKFGKIKSIDMKENEPHGKYYAFVEYEDNRDAQDAIAEMNKKRIGSSDNVSVEASKPKKDPRDRGRGRDGFGRYGERDRGRSRGVQRGRYKISIENLPDDITWQQLKKFARGPDDRWNCVFADVNEREHIGYVDYDYIEDMEEAYRRIHKKSWYGCTLYTYKMNSRDASPSPPPRRGGRNYSP